MTIDAQKLILDFKPGDSVQKFMPGDPGGLSPFVGRVTSVHIGIGCLDVQWPFGVERVHPDEIVKVNPALRRYLPPTLDQTYDSYDVAKGRQAGPKLWRTVELPAGFHRDLAILWGRKASEVAAYDHLWRKFTPLGAEDDAIKDEVGKFYLVAKNLVAMRIQQGIQKFGAYWVSQNRQYRVTQEEADSKKPFCPKCGTKMRRATYKMEKGAKHRLWACPKDLFLIKQDHMLGPGGEPVVW